MKRVMIIGDGAADLAVELEALGVATISSREAFQSFATALADPELNGQLAEVIDAHMQRGGAPVYGSDRPYLKKKKGRS